MSQFDLFKSKRQRGTQPPPPLERAIHIPVAKTLELCANHNWRWAHYPSGELRTKATANVLKAMGVKRGWPDFILLSPDDGAHFLEIKRPGSLHRTTDEQDWFADWCNDHNYPHAIVDSIRAAIAVLKHWGAVRATVSV
jgi:hypothetical protein